MVVGPSGKATASMLYTIVIHVTAGVMAHPPTVDSPRPGKFKFSITAVGLGKTGAKYPVGIRVSTHSPYVISPVFLSTLSLPVVCLQINLSPKSPSPHSGMLLRQRRYPDSERPSDQQDPCRDLRQTWLSAGQPIGQSASASLRLSRLSKYPYRQSNLIWSTNSTSSRIVSIIGSTPQTRRAEISLVGKSISASGCYRSLSVSTKGR